VHPGLKLSELLERFMLSSHSICPRATRIIVSKGDHVPGAIFGNRHIHNVRMNHFEHSRRMQTRPSCTGVPLLILLTRHARRALRRCQQVRLRQRSVRSAGPPEDHPEVSPVQMSHPSVPRRFGGLVHSARIFFEYHSFTTEFRG
jgi:hypothetical protein